MLDFGIKGRRALVCASSRGLGFGCAQALAKAGAVVIMNGRNAEQLKRSADTLRDATKATITEVCADFTITEGRQLILEQAGKIDILVNNCDGPPVGDFRNWSRDDWLNALNANMLSAIDMIKAVLEPMERQKFGRIVNITSGAVKSPIPELGLSNSARAGLTGFVAGVSRQVAKHNITINNLLPGMFNTDRIEYLIAARAKLANTTPTNMRQTLETATPTQRLGNIEEFGFACAWLCSAHSGYVVGQNILIDGGKFNSTF